MLEAGCVPRISDEHRRVEVVAARDRAMGTMIGLAVGDALGAPVEFQRRGTFPEVRIMLGGGYFRLPPGAWTDDTAMALCLADSLAHDPRLNERDLLDRFLRWLEAADNTSTGVCVGVGQNTFRRLMDYKRKGAVSASRTARADGNGALMRLAPVAVRHWRDISQARDVAARQSLATHCSVASSGACEITAMLLCRLIAGEPWSDAVRQSCGEVEGPELEPIRSMWWATAGRDAISSTGHVLRTLEAALWAVETTETFEDAVIRAVNLGDDADTVGAVAGQIAGARYGRSAIPERWTTVLAKEAVVEAKATLLLEAARPEMPAQTQALSVGVGRSDGTWADIYLPA